MKVFFLSGGFVYLLWVVLRIEEDILESFLWVLINGLVYAVVSWKYGRVGVVVYVIKGGNKGFAVFIFIRISFVLYI